MLNILYDISVLGSSHYQEVSRTGVARVIENLFRHLLDRADIELQMGATASPLHWVQSNKFLEDRYPEQACRLRPPSRFWVRQPAQAIFRRYPSPGKSGGRPERWMNRILNALGRGSASALASAADVFHSPFHPLRPAIGSGPARCLTIYDMIPVKFPQFFEAEPAGFMRRVYRSVGPQDHVLAISDSTRNDFCEYSGADPARVHVTPLAAADHFRPVSDQHAVERVRRKYAVPEGPYILSLCTLEPRKNITQLVRSFLDLVRQQKLDDLNLVLVGTKGWMFEPVFAEIEGAHELRDRIIFTGFAPDEDLPAIYSGAMMFVYPSLYEGFGLPPLEAMQCGLPVISSNTASLPEVVGDAGIMVSPTDGEALSQAMFDLYRDSGRRARLRDAGIERAAQFSWARCADQTVAAYRAAVAN